MKAAVEYVLRTYRGIPAASGHFNTDPKRGSIRYLSMRSCACVLGSHELVRTPCVSVGTPPIAQLPTSWLGLQHIYVVSNTCRSTGRQKRVRLPFDDRQSIPLENNTEVVEPSERTLIVLSFVLYLRKVVTGKII